VSMARIISVGLVILVLALLVAIPAIAGSVIGEGDAVAAGAPPTAPAQPLMPEPATLALLGLGSLGVVMMRRRRA
jgi:hypothetical protein